MDPELKETILMYRVVSRNEKIFILVYFFFIIDPHPTQISKISRKQRFHRTFQDFIDTTRPKGEGDERGRCTYESSHPHTNVNTTQG